MNRLTLALSLGASEARALAGLPAVPTLATPVELVGKSALHAAGAGSECCEAHPISRPGPATVRRCSAHAC